MLRTVDAYLFDTLKYRMCINCPFFNYLLAGLYCACILTNAQGLFNSVEAFSGVIVKKSTLLY